VKATRAGLIGSERQFLCCAGILRPERALT
jgi:hypothetical protein